MPVNIISTNYSDNFGGSGSTYISNAGDELTLEVTIESVIRVTNINNFFQYDPILQIITSTAVNLLEEGFRGNTAVTLTKYDVGGTVVQTRNVIATSVTAQDINLAGVTTGIFPIDVGAGEVLEIVARNNTFTANKKREDLLINFNHSLNDQQGSNASLIDGETTKVLFEGVGSLAQNNSITGVAVGNQSGQFLEIVDLEYSGVNSDGFDQYVLTFTFINSGVYEADWFALGDCLKIYIDGLWSSKVGEVFDRYSWVLDNQANTGWFNESNNVGIPNGSQLPLPITDLKYNVTSTNATIMVDLGTAGLSDLGIGGAYISIDPSYFQNRVENQRNITYILSTTSSLTAGSTYTSQGGIGTNTTSNWEVEIVSITQLGATTNYLIELNWLPSSGFINFLTNRADGDRLFYLWLRVGNVNHLLYGSQLTKELPVGGALDMNNDYGYLDHSENIETATGNLFGYTADTEDDLAYYGTFDLLLTEQRYESINLRVEAFNTSTNDSFTLQQTNFSFGGVTYQPSTGQYLLNQTATINPNLPTTSVKRDAKVFLTGSSGGKSYEVAVYYPFLLNWRYWLSLTGVNPDFAPDTNQNWEQYDNLTNWQIRTTVELVKDGLAFVNSNTIVDYPYDNDPNLISEIFLRLQSDNSVVNIIPDGEQLYIESTHVLTTGNFDVQKTWGMLTIEPKESAPRSICSTIVPFDNNAQNPLTPITGLLCSLTYPAPNTAVLKCKFDPSKIDTTNGVKITAKIKQGCNNIVSQDKFTTGGDQKLTTTDDDKIVT